MAAQRGLNKPWAGASLALTTDTLDALLARAARPDYPRFEAQLRSSGYCAHPVRLTGRVETCDAGGRGRVWSTDGEPDGILRKACGNRREAICPSCAERYRQDAYQLIAAGLRGGKGVPDTIAGHPAVFATFTAPAFGAVHTRRHAREGRPLPCRPRRDAPVCPHGVRLSCGTVHDEADDPRLGEPLCADCFDHEAAVRWNNTLGELWRRTTIYLPRILARLTGVTQRRLRERVRVSYVKIAEYQRRGLVHLHAVIRLDRALPAYRAGEPRPPAPTFTTDLLEDAIRTTAREARAPLPDELGGADVRWGDELDVRHLDTRERRRVAGYLAKYATKSTEQAGGVLHRVAREQIDELPVSEHIRRYLHAAFTLHDQTQAEHDKENAGTPPPPRPAPDTPRDPNRPARRAANAMSANEPVRVRLHAGSQHSGRIIRRDHHELVPDDGQALAITDIHPIATPPPAAPRAKPDRRLAACAHALGYRGHCLTKSGSHSTTFKALREARERHIHEQLLKHSHDAAQRALAETAASDRFSSLRYIGQGHLTAADAYLAASAAARAREQRRAAREALCDDQRPGEVTRCESPQG